eukprot:c6367_g1_i1.p1 GENE.c6367_g1_i1~~c6367_g1_i1.p1  ORF type:complete len:364 (+),score=34.50 c6367_g1_i1:191-1282(+)
MLYRCPLCKSKFSTIVHHRVNLRVRVIRVRDKSQRCAASLQDDQALAARLASQAMSRIDLTSDTEECDDDDTESLRRSPPRPSAPIPFHLLPPDLLTRIITASNSNTPSPPRYSREIKKPGVVAEAEVLRLRKRSLHVPQNQLAHLTSTSIQQPLPRPLLPTVSSPPTPASPPTPTSPHQSHYSSPTPRPLSFNPIPPSSRITQAVPSVSSIGSEKILELFTQTLGELESRSVPMSPLVPLDPPAQIPIATNSQSESTNGHSDLDSDDGVAASPAPRSKSSSRAMTTRKSQVIEIVKGCLVPHYKAGRITRQTFKTIARKVSAKMLEQYQSDTTLPKQWNHSRITAIGKYVNKYVQTLAGKSD